MPESAWEQNVDWEDLYQRLCALANRLFARAPIEMAPEDLAQHIIHKFLMARHRFLKPDTRDLTSILCSALKFEYHSKLRREQCQRQLMKSFIDNSAREQTIARATRSETKIEYQQIRQQLREPDLEQLLDAMVETSGESNQNQRLATLLHSTPSEVANRKKRLRRRIETISKGCRSASGEGVTP